MPDDPGPLEFTKPMPTFVRILYAAGGLFCIILPAWELRHAFLRPSLLSMFFGAIVLGAWTVGWPLLLASVLGDGQVWRVQNGRIEIRRRNVFRRWTTTIPSAEIAGLDIRTHDWDSRPETYSVVVRLRDGTEFDTPDAGLASAAQLEARLRRELGLSPS